MDTLMVILNPPASINIGFPNVTRQQMKIVTSRYGRKPYCQCTNVLGYCLAILHSHLKACVLIFFFTKTSFFHQCKIIDYFL
jgi:hypothetical protein